MCTFNLKNITIVDPKTVVVFCHGDEHRFLYLTRIDFCINFVFFPKWLAILNFLLMSAFLFFSRFAQKHKE